MMVDIRNYTPYFNVKSGVALRIFTMQKYKKKKYDVQIVQFFL